MSDTVISIEERVHQLLDVARHEARDPYAQSYLQASRGMEGNELRVQVLYILSNLATWRGPVARETKKELKELLKKLPQS